MLLADAVQVADGKLYVLGGGWSMIGPGPSPIGIAIKIEVPWHQANERHTWALELVDGDGAPVMVPTPEGEGPLQIRGDFEVGRPPGVLPGTPLDLPVAINTPPLPLPSGTRLEWRLTIDDEARQDWVLAFSTRPGA